MIAEVPRSDTWELGFVLPNLRLARTFEAAHVAIVPPDDERVRHIRERSAGARRLLGGFTDRHGERHEPAVLIATRDAPRRVWTEEAAVAFRNLVALVAVTRGWAGARTGTGGSGLLYSDYFDFHPTTLGTDDSLITITPALGSYDISSRPFHGSAAPHLPAHHPAMLTIDGLLLDALTRSWEDRFVRHGRRGTAPHGALFRSLEMAYQASATPIKNQATLHDYGVSVALWVSAFEILVHPQARPVNVLDVVQHLGRFTWRAATLNARRYTIECRGSRKVNLAQHLYKRLYDARNAFLHGNPVDRPILRPYKTKRVTRATLGQFAPVLYRTTLAVHLMPVLAGLPRDDLQELEDLLHQDAHEECLLRLVGRAPDEDD